MYVTLTTENSISFSKALILRKFIQSKEVTETQPAQSDQMPIDDGQKASTHKVRLLVYQLEISNINRANLTEDSLDRDPLAIKWTIEAEPFNKSLFTLMRTNLQNLLTSRFNIPKV